jgi:ribosomal protein S27E
MEINPAEDWHSLTDHYRTMLDGELEELADSIDDLTETAREVLRNEMRNRGLGEPGAARRAVQRPANDPDERWVSAVALDASGGESSEAGHDEESTSGDQTWKTQLCECETTEQANLIREVLRRAGIDSWAEQPPSYAIDLAGPRVVVAADQLEQAIEIARRPIPQEILDHFREEVPEFVLPKCPRCGAEDPILESAEPANNWLCEACGKQWIEPAADGEEEPAKTSR